MSLNTAGIHVETSNWDELRQAVLSHALAWNDDVYCGRDQNPGEDEAWRRLLDEKGRRRILVAPPVDGWAYVVDAFRYRADGDLARMLSMMLECRVLRVEVNGGYYSWCAFTHADGRVVDARLSPIEVFDNEYQELLWEADPKRFVAQLPGEEMPVYRNVEQDAFDFLRSRGVPACHRLTPFPFFFDSAGGTTTTGSLITIDASGVRCEDQEICLNPAQRRTPPLVCDVWALHPDGNRGQVREVRCLTGEPTCESVAALVDLEEAFHRRVQAAHATLDETSTHLPEVTFEYTMDHVCEIDERMREERSRRLGCSTVMTGMHPVLTPAEFARRTSEVLQDQLPDWSVNGQPDGQSILLRPKHDAPRRLRMQGLYQRYRQAPDTFDEHALRQSVETLLEGTLSPPSYEQLRTSLMPALLGCGLGRLLEHMPTWPMVEDLHVGLCYSAGRGVLTYLNRTVMTSLGAEPDALFSLALHNLSRRANQLAKGLHSVVPPRQPESMMLYAYFEDAHTTARVLLPAFHEAVWARLGKDALVGLPRRDALYAAAVDDADTIPLLRRQVETEFAMGPYPVSPHLYRLVPGGLQPWP